MCEKFIYMLVVISLNTFLRNNMMTFRIVVNFKCDRNADNIGLHFNPRPDEEVVVCNDKKNGEWGDEERDHFGQFCFHRGDYFDAYFVVMDDRFKVCHVKMTITGMRIDSRELFNLNRNICS